MLRLQQEYLKQPKERLKKAENDASYYKGQYETFAPRVNMAIKDVFGQRLVNQQLMLTTDVYHNFKKKACDKIFEQQKVIARQRQNEIEHQQQNGLSPYMGKLMSTLTTRDMKLYNQIADKFPNHKTPSVSDMSTPDQDTD